MLKLVPQLQAKLVAGVLTTAEARDLAQTPETRQMQAYDHGTPYQDLAKPAPEPKPEVVPEQTTSCTRTEVPASAHGASTPSLQRPATATLPRGGSPLTNRTGTRPRMLTP